MRRPRRRSIRRIARRPLPFADACASVPRTMRSAGDEEPFPLGRAGPWTGRRLGAIDVGALIACGLGGCERYRGWHGPFHRTVELVRWPAACGRPDEAWRRAWTRVRHPGLPLVVDAGEEGRDAWMAAEATEPDASASGPLEGAEFARMLDESLDALAALHVLAVHGGICRGAIARQRGRWVLRLPAAPGWTATPQADLVALARTLIAANAGAPAAAGDLWWLPGGLRALLASLGTSDGSDAARARAGLLAGVGDDAADAPPVAAVTVTGDAAAPEMHWELAPRLHAVVRPDGAALAACARDWARDAAPVRWRRAARVERLRALARRFRSLVVPTPVADALARPPLHIDVAGGDEGLPWPLLRCGPDGAVPGLSVGSDEGPRAPPVEPAALLVAAAPGAAAAAARIVRELGLAPGVPPSAGALAVLLLGEQRAATAALDRALPGWRWRACLVLGDDGGAATRAARLIPRREAAAAPAIHLLRSAWSAWASGERLAAAAAAAERALAARCDAWTALSHGLRLQGDHALRMDPVAIRGLCAAVVGGSA